MRARAASGERGQSLVELLVAVVILGIAFVAIVQGLGTTAFGSGLHRTQVDVHDALVSAAERVKEATHVPCARPADYQAAAQAAPRPAGWSASTVAVTSVTYWNGTAFGTRCYDADSGHLLTTQLVKVVVTSPDGRATENVAVAKRAHA